MSSSNQGLGLKYSCFRRIGKFDLVSIFGKLTTLPSCHVLTKFVKTVLCPKKWAILVANICSNGSRGFAPAPIPVNLLDPDSSELSSRSDSESDSEDNTMKSFHSYTVKSTGKKLQGVYTKDSQTTQWCQEKKKQELEEETK